MTGILGSSLNTYPDLDDIELSQPVGSQNDDTDFRDSNIRVSYSKEDADQMPKFF
jgi:hypothetical protein